ncbi:MAG: hypothetical protein K9M99_09380 [Candidatus Cloacimonetes bacterium]|nr:hypothetical protein [Candidatus Cloacimonadota bacterium]
MKNLICFVIILLITIAVYGDTLVVNQFDGPYYTINEAYDDAEDGYTILIYPGTYLESVYVTKAITLEGIEPNSTVIHTNSTYAIRINTSNVTISNLKIICTNRGIQVDGVRPDIINCLIENSSTGIYVYESSVDIINCVIRNCDIGVYIYQYNDSGTICGSIYNNIFIDIEQKAIYFVHGGWDVLTTYINIFNNVIANSDYGVYKGGEVNYYGSFGYNCFYNNSTNYTGVTPIADNILQNPSFYEMESGNYYLQSGSPCIDTGNPDVIFNDLDGTRNDIGIFGGPLQWGGGQPTVIDLQINPESVTPGQTIDIEATGQVK